jgi:hypothetical protein
MNNNERQAQALEIIAGEPHHQHLDMLLEFLGIAEPGLHRQAIAACRPVTIDQHRRARHVAATAWEQLLRTDVEGAPRRDWRAAFPENFRHLTDDYELMVLLLWTWVDLQSAMVYRITVMDPAIPLFEEKWLRMHLPDHRRAPFPLQDKWLCPQLCRTCRIARVSCPVCRTTARFWPPSRGGGRDRAHTIIKEVPPFGAGPVWSPDARQAIENGWTQLVLDAREERAAHTNSIHPPQWP